MNKAISTTTVKPSQNLRLAKELINTEDKWFQGDFSGTKLNEQGDEVVCYCALGAVELVTRNQHYNTKEAEYLRIAIFDDLMAQETFAPYNDSHTHAEVMVAFDKAIQLAEQDEQLN